jgi:hypothetical protein
MHLTVCRSSTTGLLRPFHFVPGVICWRQYGRNHDERDYWYMDFYMDSCVTDAGMELSPPLKTGG